MWFEKLMGFRESPEQVRRQIAIEGEYMTSLVNGRRYAFGSLEIPSLAEARTVLQTGCSGVGGTSPVREMVASVQDLHRDPDNAGALFQVASQFNLLEMMSPDVTPEKGVGIYERDPTQGPACAIAAGAGTIYRNYFHTVNGQLGQSRHNQIDCLADLGELMGNDRGRLWQMRNGYALASEAGLKEIDQLITSASAAEKDRLRQRLRVGTQRNTQVTLGDCDHRVTQVYCSALPVKYSSHCETLWENFARLVLEAAYEATLLAGIANAAQTGNNRVYLTMLGGGAFGNRKEWITDAIDRSLDLYGRESLDVILVRRSR